MSRLKKAFYCSLALGLYQVISIISAFVLPRFILTAYGSAYNGLISAITNYLGFFSIVQAGIAGASRVALYKTLANNDLEATSRIMAANRNYYRKVSFGLVGYLLFLGIIFPVIMHDEFDVVSVVSLVLIIGLNSFAQYCFGLSNITLLNADGCGYIVSFIQSVALILNTVATVLVIKAGGTVQASKFGGIIFFVISNVFLHYYTNRRYSLEKGAKPDYIAIKGRWDVLANSIANIIHANVDTLFIAIFCAPAEMSVYAIYYLTYNGLVRIIQLFTDGLEAAFGNMYIKDNKEKLKNSFQLYELFLFIITSVLTCCLFVLILPFVSLYTNGVTDVNYYRPIFATVLSVTFFSYCIRTPYVTMVQAAGKYKETKTGSFIEAGINVLTTIVFIQFWGIVGAVVGTAIANIFRSIQYAQYTNKYIIARSKRSTLSRLIWLLFTTIGSIFLSKTITHVIPDNTWLMWFLNASIVFVVSLGITLASTFLFYKNGAIQLVDMGMRIVKSKKS